MNFKNGRFNIFDSMCYAEFFKILSAVIKNLMKNDYQPVET